MKDSIFTRIVKGEIPAHKIYEDDRTLAFLDIHPIQPGHTLVIPKIQVTQLWDLDDETYQAVMASAKKVALQMRNTLGVKWVGVQVIGVDVPHAHVQLVPFDEAREYHARQDMSQAADNNELAAMAKRLKL